MRHEAIERECRMITTNELVIETFNRLLAVCKASEQAFRIAAHAVQDTELRTAFKQYSHQRARMASELRMEIRLLGGEPEMLNGMAMPSALADVVTASTQMDEQAVLLECEHMEKAVSQVFEEALDDSNMPFELVITLRRQHGEVRVAIDRLHTLERPLTAGAS
jgi:uncharacterized protein (TIGR02284 family)